MTVQSCSRCGAPLEHAADPKAPVVCRFCHAEQSPPDALAAAELVAAEVREALRDSNEKNRRLGRAIGLGVAVIAIGSAIMFARRPPPPASDPAAQPEVQPTVASTPPPAAPPPATTAAAVVDKTKVPCTVTLALAEKGGGAGAFDEARRIAVDDAGFAYVADKTGRVQRFDDKGTLVSTLRAEATSEPHGSLSTDIVLIHGLAVDHKGRLFVPIGYDVIIYDAVTFKVAARLKHAYPSTCFRDIVVDQTGLAFVRSACTDSNRYAIVKIDREGKVLSTFPESPAWEHDTSDKMAIDGAGLLYAPHKSENQIDVLDARGKLGTHFGGQGDQPGYFHSAGPGPLVIDGKGRLFATNWDDIDVYDLGGHSQGRLPQLWKGLPRDIAVGPDGSLWVVSFESGALRLTVGQ